MYADSAVTSAIDQFDFRLDRVLVIDWRYGQIPIKRDIPRRDYALHPPTP
jgi:hypothetical protein